MYNRNKKNDELEKRDFKSDESNQSISGFLKIKLNNSKIKKNDLNINVTLKGRVGLYTATREN